MRQRCFLQYQEEHAEETLLATYVLLGTGTVVILVLDGREQVHLEDLE